MSVAEPVISQATRLEASRAAGLRRLQAFVPMAADYGRLRSFEGPGESAVSGLSPYLRYRLIDEAEVLAAVRALSANIDSFVRQVFWRSYFKGWLQMRPGVWGAYEDERDAALNDIEREPGRRQVYDSACEGKTGIACFDAWSDELRATGTLHNHARMWFASIWIYTLELPWALGADFFYRHLLDGDPASNTLSWRWVCGLHTRGKTYLARRDNIRKYTRERFDPEGLASEAPALDGPAVPAADSSRVPSFQLIDGFGKERTLPKSYSLLVTPEDLLPERVLSTSLLDAASASCALRRASALSPRNRRSRSAFRVRCLREHGRATRRAAHRGHGPRRAPRWGHRRLSLRAGGPRREGASDGGRADRRLRAPGREKLRARGLAPRARRVFQARQEDPFSAGGALFGDLLLAGGC